MPRSLSCTSNSRPFRQTPHSGHILFSREFSGQLHPKSLFFNILPINRLDLIFCEELFLAAFCFQYFASKAGRGYSRANSLAVPQKSDPLGAISPPGQNIKNSLCGIGTLVYGDGFAKTQARVWPTDRVFEKDGPFQYSGRERNSLAKSLSAAFRFGSPQDRARSHIQIMAERVVEVQCPRPHDRLSLSSNTIQDSSVCSPQGRTSVGEVRHVAANLHMNTKERL